MFPRHFGWPSLTPIQKQQAKLLFCVLVFVFLFDLLMMSTYCSKRVEAHNKLIIKEDFVH